MRGRSSARRQMRMRVVEPWHNEVPAEVNFFGVAGLQLANIGAAADCKHAAITHSNGLSTRTEHFSSQFAV